ncbi:hypothetical protein CDAR_472561 [Caerostris darwini]|uniref:Uncharacterized protein n=1 Tax=Caerostris darwini TaxID=1538125 RepID=A0AAV4RT33_9ARAC|nr:hypothetical protein CDAR_472561 [Caerostris darwini]
MEPPPSRKRQVFRITYILKLNVHHKATKGSPPASQRHVVGVGTVTRRRPHRNRLPLTTPTLHVDNFLPPFLHAMSTVKEIKGFQLD